MADAAAGRQPPRGAERDAGGPGRGGVRWPRLPGSRRREARRAAGAAPSRDPQAGGGTGRLRRRPRAGGCDRGRAGAAGNDCSLSLHPGPVHAACEPRRRWSFGLTGRSIGLLTAGFLLAGPGLLGSRLGYAMLAWDALVLLAALLDGLRLPRAPATRRHAHLVQRARPRQRNRDRIDH